MTKNKSLLLFDWILHDQNMKHILNMYLKANKHHDEMAHLNKAHTKEYI